MTHTDIKTPEAATIPKDRIVCIFGMGLLGGSIALGLRERGLAREVWAFDPDAAALEAALVLGAADRVFTSLGPWIKDVDLGVLSAPTRAIIGLADGIAPWAKAEALWLDVGSTKGAIVEAVPLVLPNFVGTHPMAGRETPGVQHAYAGLLQSAIWAICPTPETPEGVLRAVTALVEDLGAYPLTLDAKAHDRAVARISHVPWLLATALNLQLAADPDATTLLALAAGGFRDLTRVASGAPEMSRDMVISNAVEVRVALRELGATLVHLSGLLDSPEALLDEATRAKRTRDSLPIVRRSLLPRVYDVVVSLDDRPLELASLTRVLGEAGINIRDIEILKIRDGAEAIRVGVASDGDLDAAKDALGRAGYRYR